MSEYRVDELARRAGTTVRNVRAYQERGLIAPPRREGRVGWYSDTHLARLRAIGSLLERGYTLQNITELLGAAEAGQNLNDLFGLAAAMTGPFSDELPATITLAQLWELFGEDAGPEVLEQALAGGILERDRDDRFRVPSPRLLHAGAELHRAGVPLSDLMTQRKALKRDVERIAARLVDLVAGSVFGDYRESLPPPEAVPELAQVVQRLRPLAQVVVDVELARALERHATKALGDTLDSIIAHLRAEHEAAG